MNASSKRTPAVSAASHDTSSTASAACSIPGHGVAAAARRTPPSAQPPALSWLAGPILALLLAPSHAADNGHHEEWRGKSDQHRSERHRDRDHDRDRNGYIRGNYYPQPVYVPPVVEYVPPQSPGISLFVPLNIRLR